MNILEIKNDLLRLLANTDDVEILNCVHSYFKILKSEPFSEEEIQGQESRMIEIGLKQIKNKQVMSNELAKSRIKDFFNIKKKENAL